MTTGTKIGKLLLRLLASSLLKFKIGKVLLIKTT